MAGDLYTEWLGLKPCGPRPPDYYSLLGLPVFTRRVTDIEDAARGQLDKLDRYAIHPDREKRDNCQKMMNEVAVARVILTDPARREPYDQELAAAMGVEPPPPGEGVDDGYALNALDDSLEEGEADAATQKLLNTHTVISQTANQAPPVVEEEAPPKVRKKIPLIAVLGVIAGVAAIGIAVGVVFALKSVSTEEQPPPENTVEQPPTQAVEVVVTPPPPPPPDQVDFDEPFENSSVDYNRFQYETALGALSSVAGELLIDLSTTRPMTLVIVPTTEGKRVEKATIELSLEEGATAHIEVDEGARLTLTNRHGNGAFELPTGMGVDKSIVIDPTHVTLEMLVDRYTATWKIDGNDAGKTPPTSLTTEPPSIRIVFAGEPGRVASIDRVQVVYKRNVTQPLDPVEQAPKKDTKPKPGPDDNDPRPPQFRGRP